MARRIGRPPLDPESASVPVTVRMPARQYDALYQQAQRERTTVAEVLRRSSRLSYSKLDADPPDDY